MIYLFPVARRCCQPKSRGHTDHPAQDLASQAKLTASLRSVRLVRSPLDGWNNAQEIDKTIVTTACRSRSLGHGM